MTAAAAKSPALTTYADPSQMRAWVQDAAPGHSIKYAYGPRLDPCNPSRVLALEWQARGLCELFAPRDRTDTSCFNYIARKRAQMVPESARRDEPLGQPPQDAAWRYSIDGRLYELLCEAADDKRPCPSNEAIAEILGLPDRYRARDRFNGLVRAGLIHVVEPNRFGMRVIEICASGRRTKASNLSRATPSVLERDRGVKS